MILGALAGKSITIQNCEPAHVEILTEILRSAGAGVAINKNEISAATAGAAHRLSDGFFVGAEIALILVFLAGAIAVLGSRLLPRWWAWLMILVAIVLVIGPIGWAALIFATPIWVLGTTAMLLRSRTTRTEAAPPATV